MDIPVCLGQILADIEISTFVLIVGLYPSKAVEFPKVLKEESADIGTITEQGVEV